MFKGEWEFSLIRTQWFWFLHRHLSLAEAERWRSV